MKKWILAMIVLAGCSAKKFTFVDRYRTTLEDPVRWYHAHYKLQLHDKNYKNIFRKDSLPSNTYFELLFSDSSILYVQADVGLVTPNTSSIMNKYKDYNMHYVPWEDGYRKESDSEVFEGRIEETYWKEILYPDLIIGYRNVPDTMKAEIEEVLNSLKLVRKEYF